jgi:flagellar biosynthesis/type III secretory pathway chaperone
MLSEESALLGQLAGQLQAEHGFLAANDVDALENSSAVRQQTLAQLLRLEERRGELCRRLGRGHDRTALAAVLAWCDPEGSLATAQAECAQLAGRCRAQNERNGALVTARLNRVTGMLDLLADGTATRTYQPRATRYAAPPAGRMVSVSA